MNSERNDNETAALAQGIDCDEDVTDEALDQPSGMAKACCGTMSSKN